MMMNKESYLALHDCCAKIRWLIDDLHEYYADSEDLQNVSLKVRPNYGYAKFYLNAVEGSYDMSLQALIHFMLYEHKHFKKILNKDTYKKVDAFYAKNPECLFDFGENEQEQELIDWIEHLAVCYTRRLCEIRGFNTDEWKASGAFEFEVKHPELTLESTIDDFVVHGEFFWDVEHRLQNSQLNNAEEDWIITVIDNIWFIDHLLQLVEYSANKHPKIAKKAIEKAIAIHQKNSELSKIARIVKKSMKDELWADQIKTLKK